MSRTSRSTLAALLLGVMTIGCGSGPRHTSYFDEPAPVRLPAGLDDRSPADVLQHGRAIIESRPAEAARLFLWAAALDPTWASPIFARRTALLMAEPHFYERYIEGSRSVLRDPRTIQLDSMYLRALQLNPFLDRSLESVALRYQIGESYRRRVGRANVQEGELAHAIEQYLGRAGPHTRAWLAHADGRFTASADLYTSLLQGRNDNYAPWTRVELARVLFRIGRHDAARQELAKAIAALRAGDEDRLVRVYRSKALLEHTAGLVSESLGDPEGARAHYANALQEDLGYHPAHLRMAGLALADNDTETARAAHHLALQIAPRNATVLWEAGQALAAMGDAADAEAAFLTLIEVAPEFASPYHALATLRDERGDHAGALEAYREFLERAYRRHPSRESAERRLESLIVAGAGGDGP